MATDNPEAPTPVSLDTTVEAPVQRIQLDSGTNGRNYTPSPELAAARSFKAAYGLETTPAAMPQVDIQNSLYQGREDAVRTEAAAKIAQVAYQQRQDEMLSFVNSKTTPLTAQDLVGAAPVNLFNANPKSVFETNYATNYIGELDRFAQKQGDPNFWVEATAKVPNDVAAMKVFGTVTMAQREVALTMAQDLNNEIEKQGTVGYVADFAKLAFPMFNPYQELKFRGNVPGSGFTEGGLLGENLEAQRQRLLALPFDQYVTTLSNIVTNLRKDNPQAALMFVTSMLGQTIGERHLNNLGTIGTLTDVGTIVGGVRTLTKSVQQVNQVRTAIKQVLQSTASPEATKANILSSVGNLEDAAVATTTQKVTQGVAGSLDPVKDAVEALPRHLQQDAIDIAAAPGKLSTAQVNILREQFSGFESKFLQVIANVMRPNRIPIEEATADVLKAMKASVIDRYPGLSNGVIDVSDPLLEPISNTYIVTMRISKPGGDLFKSPEEAIQWAQLNGYKIGEGSVEQRGLGFNIVMNRSLNETDKVIRDFVWDKNRASSVSPSVGSKWDMVFGYARTAEDTMSAEHRALRKSAVYPQAVLSALAKEQSKYIEDVARGITRTDPVTGEAIPFYRQGVPVAGRLMSRGEWNAFNGVLKEAQRAIDPVTKEKGYFFKTQTELEDYYQRIHDRNPSWTETQGYWANKRLVEMDRMLREISEFRNRARLGNETHIVSYEGSPNYSYEGAQSTNAAESGTAPINGRVNSPAFDGVSRPKLPGGQNGRSATGNVLFVGDNKESSKVLDFENMLQKDKTAISKKVKSGELRLIELYDPESRPFAGFVEHGEKRVQYVLTANAESKPLSWNQVARRGGGHFEYEYDNYVKQAKVRHEKIGGRIKSWYEGDQTVMPAEIRALGEDVSKHLNEVRTKIKGGDEVGAEAYARSKIPALDWKELRGHFNPKKDANGVLHPPVFNLDQPFQVVPKGKAIINMSDELEKSYPHGQFHDGTREGSMARNFQTAYTGRRDAYDMFTLNNKGTYINPIYAMKPAELVDPIQMMNRGLNRIINSTFMDDYKITAVERWLREAGPHLKADDSEIRSSPFWHFNNPSWRSGAKPEFTSPLMANRFKIQQLVGTPSTAETFLHSIASGLADAAYTIPRGATEKLAHPFKTLQGTIGQLTPAWLLPKLRDPFQFIRSVTYNAYIGLFAIPQIVVQNMTYASIFALNPRHAVTGTMGAFFHQLSRINQTPEVLAHLDNLATKMRFPGLPRWKSGEWTEAMRELDKTGFANIGGEFAPLDNMRGGSIIRGPWGKFLEAGQVPFKAGERNVRYGAWYTAFKEYRDLHPTGAITNADRVKILDKADLLYGNMSSASNSVLHTGIFSLPTQFYAYNIRLAELFMSKRIGETVAERTLARTRIIAVNAALFGVPMAAGLSGYPFGDMIKQAALEGTLPGQSKPYIVGEKWLNSLLMEGIPAHLLALATGTYYNIGERYGLQGFTQIKEALQSDAKWWKIVGGASASLTMNTWAAKDGLVDIMTSFFKDDPQKKFVPKVEHFIDFFKEIQSVNKGWALWVAIHTGKWINKNSDIINDGVGATDAIFRATTGLQTQDQANIFHERTSMKDLADLQKHAMKRAEVEINRAIIALGNKDSDSTTAFLTNAQAIMTAAEMDETQISHVIARSMKTNGNLVDRTAWEFYKDKAPKSRRELMDEALTRRATMNKGK